MRMKFGLALALLLGGAIIDARGGPPRPNVILLMTDDQGFGDLGEHGNPVIRTPQLDALARQSVWFKNFYVSPVCAPTRASLMTGRYNYRTGVVDTYLGRAMMHGDEVTLAEMLRTAGYRTGIFGKWHLGDNYPMRPIDQGFDEALVHNGGGIGQPADPPGNLYTDPILQHNGKSVRSKGYCSDIFTDAAIDFITADRERPFFVYIPYNCPHSPLQVPASYAAPYEKMDLSISAFPQTGFPLRGKISPETTAKVYGMITNIDDNVGKLLTALERMKLAENTIVIFLTDNGPQQNRYNGGLRGRKGSVYDGGIRVPCYVRWPARLKAGHVVDRIAAHIDIVPTLLAACGVKKPAGVKLDGRSLLPLLKGERIDWADRTLYFQWHRGDEPIPYRGFAARGQRFKLVQANWGGHQKRSKPLAFELFDMRNDPFETKNIVAEHPDVVKKMKADYQAWFRDVSGTRGYAPPRIHLGTPHENPVILTRQDWRGPKAGWRPESLGYWEVTVAREGTFDVTFRFSAVKKNAVKNATARFSLGSVTKTLKLATDAKTCTFQNLRLAAGDGRLEAVITEAGRQRGVQYVDVARRE